MKVDDKYICDWCKAEIVLTPVKRCKFRIREHQFCSKDCYLKFHSRNTKPVSCAECGKPVKWRFDYNKLNRNHGHKFCSKKCLHDWRDKNVLPKLRKDPALRVRRLKMPFERTCPICNKTFEAVNKKRIYCSEKCFNKHFREKRKIKTACTQCGKEILQDKYGVGKHKPFCSKECLSTYQSIVFPSRYPPNTTCIICGKPLRRPKCRAKVKNPTCSYRCGAVRLSLIRGPSHPLYRGLSDIGYLNFKKDLKRQIKERDGNQCTMCGDKQKLVVHHIDYDKKNPAPQNLITLCNTCHRYTNHYRWFWKLLFPRIMARIVEVGGEILIGQKRTASPETNYRNHAAPVPTLGMNARSLYHRLAKLHPKSELRPTDENCPPHIQIPSLMELLCSKEEKP